VYSQFHAQLPLPTRLLIAASGLVTHYWWACLLVLIGAGFAFRSWIATEKGKLVWDRAKLRLPLVGRLIRKIVVARFVRTLGTLVGAGVPLLAALETASRVANNAEFTVAIRKVGEEVSKGSSLSAPLRACRRFPNLVPRLVQSGEESGDLEGMLLRLAHFFDRDIEHAVRRLTALMEPVLTVVLGGIVGTIVISLYMPIFTLAAVIRR
jgi:type IV pilus assembly protein PilC